MFIGPQDCSAGEKGRFEMLVQSQLRRTLIAIAAALAMSAVTVGAAVGPAQAVVSAVQAPVYA
jgi:F0F1-type ATP synthase membrane subunit c/vacuolar-type H+-ATPase subunit K